jgi:putative membrane protein
MWAFAFFAYQTGKIVNHWFSKGKFYWSALVSSITIFAVAFIIQGALDLAMTFLGYGSVDQLIIILEVASGFLLAVFGGLLNMSMRSVAEKTGELAEMKESTSDMVD